MESQRTAVGSVPQFLGVELDMGGGGAGLALGAGRPRCRGIPWHQIPGWSSARAVPPTPMWPRAPRLLLRPESAGGQGARPLVLRGRKL